MIKLLTQLQQSKPFRASIFKAVAILLKTAGIDMTEFCDIVANQDDEPKK